MTVYLVSTRGTLHKAIQDASGQRMSYEGDNLDAAELTLYTDLAQVPSGKVKRYCLRCFPKGSQ